LSSVGFPGLLLLLVMFALIALFGVALALFIRKLLQRQADKRDSLTRIEQKLDKLMEQQENRQRR
jgi:hypothetical protein